ncbi:hypothetical protein EV361DRAFT_800103 [Lentinula raphanica]|uniref:Uncharacterized protein n=1 Tax=Lentinula raphanica TaxID=153919 RepID=A0AA38PCN8_9AGAR|nr:hypothetical protein F5880DRAFT_1474040 [Lentinula raphanica]KAJ3840473.1 hypothetical protein F5878DRAFT_533606 [Lentinula raphanica]KAJ3971434.1 hypothetical protein EV361DRAFT_800103 [Lentinula raphanica]
MSASKEDLRVSIETMSDWSRIKANYAQVAKASLAKELAATGSMESNSLSQHLEQFVQNTFRLAQPNLRVNGQTFDERGEDDIEPFDEALDRHVWSLHDQRLGLHKTLAVTRRIEPSKVEKTMLGSLEQYQKLDTLESNLQDLPGEFEMDTDIDADAVQDALLRTNAWAQELSQSIPNQTERTTRLKNVTAELKRPEWR